MARRLVGVLGRLALACPICAVPEGVQMTEGVRGGALVLLLITVAVMATLAALGLRLWRAERDDP